MLGFLARWAESWAESAARAMLARLPDRIGLPDRAADPGLTAVIDQHAAAVRDILDVGVPGSAGIARPVLLAGYARGLLDQGREQGWHPVTAVQSFEQSIEHSLEHGLHHGLEQAGHGVHAGIDWLTARLWAVCDLALRLDEPTLPEPVF